MLTDLTNAVIEKIVVSVTDEVICVVKPIRIAPIDPLPSIKRCSLDVFDDVKLVAFKDVRRIFFIVVLFSVSCRSFVSHS